MTNHIHNWANAGIGIFGWFIANARLLFKSMDQISLTITSLLGVVMLVISIRTSIVKYRMKKIEYRRMKRQEEEES